MSPVIRHVSAYEGYERWAGVYDQTPNPVVAMDRRHTLPALRPQPGEHILDAGCGTGGNFLPLWDAGAYPVGIDFSPSMLAVAHRAAPQTPLVVADLNAPLPFRDGWVDASLCSLVGEHLADPEQLLIELRRVSRENGRIVFSVYHPLMAAAGIEANFQAGDVEYRLGAHAHTVADYVASCERAGWHDVRYTEHVGDETLVRAIPSAKKFVGRPILLLITARV